MKWPPGNANAALAKWRREELTKLHGAYHGSVLVQAGVVWNGWKREAARLFGLYWRSGDLKHFHAFGRHIDAMRRRASEVSLDGEEKSSATPFEFFGLKKTTESSVSSWVPRVMIK